VLLQRSHSAVRDLEDLQQRGVQISVDDFGTGYSSLARLTSLHVDQLKIERTFVAGLEDPNNVAIIRAVVGLGRALNIEVLAEGAETGYQVDQVRLAGCDAVQGYYTGYPMEAGQFEAFLRTWPADQRAQQQSHRMQAVQRQPALAVGQRW
jgi:EAL domain-containing protein (putative c-di-GMP-specific phosphodiesterase class I)